MRRNGLALLAVLLVLLICATNVSADVTIDVVAKTGSDTVILGASYMLEDYEWGEVYADVLWAVESHRWGVGVSACSEKTGIGVVDATLDFFRVDGLGLGGYYDGRKIEACGYLKFGVYEW
jgi:hypothetical protein